MRTTKELLQLMINEIETGSRCNYGLCMVISHVPNVTIEEVQHIRNYIKTNRPSKYSSFSAYFSRNSTYYWRLNNPTPRIDWIKKHIKINQ